MARILIIDDDVDILSAAKLLLKRHFGEVTIEKNPERIPFLLGNYSFDLILLDMNFTRDVDSGKEGFQWLDKILDIKPEAKVVLFTAYGDVEMAVKAIKLGAKDFVLKPWENEKLLETLHEALNETSGNEATAKHQLIGESKSMKEVFERMKRVAETDANVLILGENGTGKDLMAQALHRYSLREKQAFVRADIAALPDTLVEAELFGYVKGAFTDAKDTRIGKFEEAQKGTMFLDEIGNLSPVVQSKLLHVLQNRSLMRLGSNKEIALDIRLICATNENLSQRVAEGSFRQDLLYRINTITLEMPALRERDEDVELLAEHFLKTYAQKYNRTVDGLSAGLKKELYRYNWPGNVRELQHAIERAVILCRSRTLSVEDVFEHGHMKPEKASTKSFDLESMERKLIAESLKKCKGNISDAAKELGLSRAALYRRIEKYGL
ncbi:sigma-54 dependent transcriptional regulator [Marinilongibacter aquaticus]|uniref:sigma-54-dependent transcriptional regulator n=1 Tax=Marinilongibacter aquaticus TaxID=2975157 RepID=UPI0021BD55D3|nr:sigma-54 dependent transcriptional regulator [Marinilongibacter aquaticus]UBM57288.1 sigma-54 dependent transcriptional regulator [Marinilongibacter aquaticus]